MRFCQVSMGCQATFLEAFTSQYGLTYILIYIYFVPTCFCPQSMSPSHQMSLITQNSSVNPENRIPNFSCENVFFFPGLEPVTGAPISIDRLGRQGVQHGSPKLGFHHFG